MFDFIRTLTFSKPPGYVLATIAISLGGWLNGNDTGSIGAVTEMAHFQKDIGALSPFLRGFTVSIIMLTGAFPSIYAGQLADKYGRLKIIMLGASLFVLGAVMQGAAHQLPVFIVGRAMSGIGFGTWMSPLNVYVTEIAPSARRGMLMATPQLANTAGICCGYFTAYGTVKIDSSLSWRSIYIIQASVGLVFATACLAVPESPRWHLLKGHTDEAINCLDRLNFSRVEAEKDLLGPAARRQITAQPGLFESLIMIFRRPYRARTSLAFIMMAMIQMSGIDGVLYYAPILFSEAGLPKTTASFIASGLSAVLMFAITIPALILVDRFNRRSVTLSGGVLLTGCMFTIGSLYAANAVHSTGAARYVVVALVFIFSLTYCATWGIVGKIYASEIQPNATRSAANTVAQGLNFLTNWVVAILTPILLASSTFSAYFLFGGFCIVSVTGLWIYMPETRGQSLEAIEEAFNTPLTGSSKAVRVVKRWFDRATSHNVSDSGSGSSRASIVSSGSAPGPTPTEVDEGAIELADLAHTGAQSNTSALDNETPAKPCLAAAHEAAA